MNSGTQVDSSTSRRSSQAAATSLQMQLQSSSQPGLPMSQQQQLSQFSQGLTMSQLSQNSDDFPPNEQVKNSITSFKVKNYRTSNCEDGIFLAKLIVTVYVFIPLLFGFCMII